MALMPRAVDRLLRCEAVQFLRLGISYTWNEEDTHTLMVSAWAISDGSYGSIMYSPTNGADNILIDSN
jgi:hypothetical protein